MTSLKIQRLNPIEHILKRPDMYVGSIRPKESLEYICEDTTTFSLTKKTITYPPALLRVFVEALSNAIDNAQRSKEAGIQCSKIKICIDRETGETSIWNDGFVIPVEQQDGIYKHTLIFGELRTSTNFDDTEERTVSGRNGLGVKLLNVFSKKFSVTGVDPSSKRQFVQKWENNMRLVKPPNITVSTLKTGSTEVSWIPDFELFGMKCYTDDVYNLYMRYIIDAAMLTKLNVFVNGEKLPIKSLQDYAKLFVSPTNELVYIKGHDSEVVVSTAEEFESVSFVNGVFTMNGGKHVDGWSEAIFRPIVDHYNKPKKPQVTIKDVKQFYRLFIVSTLVNPEFSSQSKTELVSPDVKAVVEKKTISAILRWEQTKKIVGIIQSKEMLVMKKIESKRRVFKAIDGYEPANEAGGKHNIDCTLALCEGLSAKTFAIKGMESTLFGKSGRDWFGVYALRGKILNVIKSNPTTISENKVIKDVIQALGLRYDVDYTDDENFRKLNYGRLLILTDADTDGKHIAGLIMTLIHHLFPTLLDRETPFLVDMMTPIAKFTTKSGERVFYDLHSADEYYKANASSGIQVKYYKGLGTHSDDEISSVFGKRVIGYVKDELAHKSIHKAFGKDTNERKTWMEHYNPHNRTPIDESTLSQTISHFIDESFIAFPIDDCKRSIPSIVDGLKQSQRKILYACFLRNLRKSLKVAQLAGFVAEKTNYHHGEQNLYETITKMANEFVGSNNIPLLTRDGQFGSRSEGGKDAANARYIFTCLENITRYIFREEDDELLERIVDDGDIVEPIYYVPIIPMVLVNGTEGIGTGWSSSIPLHNPIDVANMVRQWIENSEDIVHADGIKISIFNPISPWYRGFEGVIRETNSDSYITEGVCSRDPKDNVVVTEIPVGMKIQDLQETLDKMREEKKIKSYKNYSSANQTHYIIEENDNMVCDINTLKLKTHLSYSNMVLFDAQGQIKRYESVDDIVEEFCDVRMKYYVLRRKRMMDNLEKRLLILKNKKRFIDAVMNDEIVLRRKKSEDIVRELSQNGYYNDNDNFAYLFRLQINTFTLEKITELEETIKKLEEELRVVCETGEKTMWLNDLKDFELEYSKWLRELTIVGVSKTKSKKVQSKKVQSKK